MGMFGLKYLSVCEVYAIEEVHAFATASIQTGASVESLFAQMSTAA